MPGHGDVEADAGRSALTASLVERLAPVEGDVDGVALAAQAPGHGLGQLDLVVDDQQPHGPERYRPTTAVGDADAPRAPRTAAAVGLYRDLRARRGFMSRLRPPRGHAADP